VIIGTAGHIDHGKTTLVRALTGIDTDRLKEEKERGISIELGYAYVLLSNGDMLGFVDVPGHEKLIHTMAAGANGIDYALLVVAADDGVMPQTREHLAILDLLGVSRAVVAITKSDRVDTARIEAVRSEIDALLDETVLRNAPIFVVNTLRADDGGLAALREHLYAAAVASKLRNCAGLFRLAIDRVFTLAGHGTVVTGTAYAGEVHVGDTVNVMPQGRSVRVRGIHANHRQSDVGVAGQRCAINLAGVEKAELARSDWLADARAFVPSPRIDVRLRVLGGAPPLHNWTPVHVHLGTAHRLAHVVPLDHAVLAPGATARAQLVFDEAVCAATGDRLLMRDAQARHTLGGGRVLDANAPARKRRSVERMRWLNAIEVMLEDGDVAALLQHARFGFALNDLERIAALPGSALVLPADAHMFATKPHAHVIAQTRRGELRDATLAALGTFHVSSPEDPGVEITRLRRMAAPTMPESPWRALVDELVAERCIARNGSWLHLPEHRVAMSAQESLLADKLAPLLDAGAFDPPWVRDLAKTASAAEAEVRGTLRKLARSGAVHQIVPDLFYPTGRVRELAVIAAQLTDEHGDLTAAAFRDRLGIGRKRAIQILEFFDRVGYTRRVRDAHRLRGEREGFF